MKEIGSADGTFDVLGDVGREVRLDRFGTRGAGIYDVHKVIARNVVASKKVGGLSILVDQPKLLQGRDDSIDCGKIHLLTEFCINEETQGAYGKRAAKDFNALRDQASTLGNPMPPFLHAGQTQLGVIAPRSAVGMQRDLFDSKLVDLAPGLSQVFALSARLAIGFLMNQGKRQLDL